MNSGKVDIVTTTLFLVIVILSSFIRSYQKIKLKVWDGRLLSPLFDTQKYTLDLEKTFHKMWRRFEKGHPPDHVVD